MCSLFITYLHVFTLYNVPSSEDLWSLADLVWAGGLNGLPCSLVPSLPCSLVPFSLHSHHSVLLYVWSRKPRPLRVTWRHLSRYWMNQTAPWTATHHGMWCIVGIQYCTTYPSAADAFGLSDLWPVASLLWASILSHVTLYRKWNGGFRRGSSALSPVVLGKRRVWVSVVNPMTGKSWHFEWVMSVFCTNLIKALLKIPTERLFVQLWKQHVCS